MSWRDRSVFGISAIVLLSVITLLYNKRSDDRMDELNKEKKEDMIDKNDSVSYESLIGNTPLVLLKEASRISGCLIYVKMECMNPGGTGKDRAAMSMLREAKRSNPLYKPGCNIVEGTSGSTGIALANLCLARGLQLHIVMPDDQADEKRHILECLGAQVHIVPNCAISNAKHYVNAARKLAQDINGIFLNQFENLANYQAHVAGTGPEIWKQLYAEQTGFGNADNKCKLDAFVMSAGTGGTIAGVSQYLKQVSNNEVQVVLADPQGSSLFNKVMQGVCYTHQQSETKIKKHRYDSIVEGVGLDRVTANFSQALDSIDSAECVPDQEILLTAHWLLVNEGLFVGSSSALNVAAALQVAKRLGKGSTVVTIICDTGHRHMSRFWNKEYIGKYNLVWPEAEKNTGTSVEKGEKVLPACIQAFL